MFSRKKKIERRKQSYEKYAADLAGKIERTENKELQLKLGEVLDAMNGMSILDTNSKLDAKVKAKLAGILSINDASYPDVAQRFSKDCASLVNIISGGNTGYKLTFREKKAREKRLASERDEQRLQEAIKNVADYNEQILAIEGQVEELNKRILKEKDESKAVLILRERKNLERSLRQKITLKEQNDRVISLAANEKYVQEQQKINDSFDLKRMSSTAQQMQKLAAEQRVNDRLYEEIAAMTDRSMNRSLGATADELRELREVRKEVEKEQQQKVFERSSDVLSEIEEQFEEQLEEGELKV